MSISTYIVRRSNTYYFRARVPADVAVGTGRAQVVMSLRTADLRVAKITSSRVFCCLASICAKIRIMVDDVFFTSRIDGLTRAQRLTNAAFLLGQKYEIQRAQLQAEFDQWLQLLAASIASDDPELTLPALPLADIPDATLLELFKLGPGRIVRPEMPARSDTIERVLTNPPYIERTEPEAPMEVCKTPPTEYPPSVSWTRLKPAFFKDKPGLITKTRWSYNQAFDDWQKLT